MMQFQEERLWAAASSMAASEVLTETIAYLREREAFGQPLLANQFIYFKLAELNTEIESVRALLYRAVELYVGGTDVTQLASMAKLKAARVSREVADWCLQFWGGMGYIEDTRVNRYWRDSRLGSIGGGATRSCWASSPRRWASCRVREARVSFDTLLVAKGGIARILRSARDGPAHRGRVLRQTATRRSLADVAVPIGPSPAIDSYLSVSGAGGLRGQRRAGGAPGLRPVRERRSRACDRRAWSSSARPPRQSNC